METSSILNPENNCTIISTLQTSSGMATTASDKAETLNKYFNSIFTAEDTQNLPDMPSSPHPPMQDINITPESVHTLLSKLDPYKASGPDNIPARVLKETGYETTPMLTHLFQQSLDTGHIPHDWRL